MWHDVLRWFDEHGSGVSALTAIVTAVVAIVALVRTANDSRSRAQPMVLAEIRRAPDADTSFDLVVRNAGPTVAREVQVTFVPPLELPDERPDESYATLWIMKRYEHPVPTLAPGQELSNTWWFGAAVGNEIQNVEPTPDRVVVRIRYKGRGGRKLSDSFVLDMAAHIHGTSTTSTSSTKGRIKSIDESLKKIANAE